MSERVMNPERKGTVVGAAETLVGMIDDGAELRGEDVIAAEEIEDAFSRLREIHLRAGAEAGPDELSRLLREAGRVCRTMENPSRGAYLALAVADMARMDFIAAYETVSVETLENVHPEEPPLGEQMPPEYYATLALLVEATRHAAGGISGSYTQSLGVTQRAAVLVGNSNYGKVVQQGLLRRLEETGAPNEVILNAYLTVPNKVRLPLSYIEGDAFKKAEGTVAHLRDPDGAKDISERREWERKGNYIRAIHDVLGAATVLRRKMPWLRPEELTAALYMNAANLGALAERLTSANPLDHKLQADDASLFLERLENAGHTLRWSDGLPYPQISVPISPPNPDEFPERFLSRDPDERRKQKAVIARQRAHASRCPVRHMLSLQSGETRKRIEELDAEIQEWYGIDPGIFTKKGDLNPAALTVARTIQAGVLTGMWERGLE